jgi:alkylation response protein AidB-like acyl-CoA dehydrogenase
MFEISKSQKQIQKAARDFAKGEFDKEFTLELEEKREFPEKIWKKAADLGFIGIQYDEAYEGGGLGVLEGCLIAEEFCRKDSTMGMALSLTGLGSEALFRFGDNSLKEKFLPKIVQGEMLSGIAFAEDNFGLDLSSIETVATTEGDKLIINGEKTNVLNGGAAGFYIVLCKSDPDGNQSENQADDLTLVLVEANRDGISINDLGEKLGINMVKTAGISFTDVQVPTSNIIGKEGKAKEQLKAFFNEIKILTAAQALGTAQGALDRAIDYSKQREQFNRKLSQFQVIRHKLADMATKVELARLITYKAAWNFDNGKADDALIAMAKMTAGRMAVEVTDEAIQIFGGYGYMKESEVERFYRDAKVAELSFGNRDKQLEIVANSTI